MTVEKRELTGINPKNALSLRSVSQRILNSFIAAGSNSLSTGGRRGFFFHLFRSILSGNVMARQPFLMSGTAQYDPALQYCNSD